MKSMLDMNAVSVTTFKKSPTTYINESNGETAALLKHNCMIVYLVPAARYAALLEMADNLNLAQIVRDRTREVGVLVDFDPYKLEMLPCAQSWIS